MPIKGAYNAVITWSSSDSERLSVDNETGLMTVVRPESSEERIKITLSYQVEVAG